MTTIHTPIDPVVPFYVEKTWLESLGIPAEDTTDLYCRLTHHVIEGNLAWEQWISNVPIHNVAHVRALIATADMMGG